MGTPKTGPKPLEFIAFLAHCFSIHRVPIFYSCPVFFSFTLGAQILWIPEVPSYQIVEVRTLHLWARLVTGLKRTPTLLPRSLQGALIVYNFHQVLKAGGKTTQPYQFVSPYQIVSTVKGLYSLKSYQIVHPSQLPETSGIL